MGAVATLGGLARRVRGRGARLLRDLADVLDPGGGCPVAWTPAPLTPVWSGRADHEAGDGPPVDVRVWYPAATSSGPPLTGCGLFPLVLLVHGQCAPDAAPHLHWESIAISLARSGYVVAAPNLGGLIHFDSATNLGQVRDTVAWIVHQSPYAPVVHRWEIGVAGHSYGGLLAMRYALGASFPPVSTVAVLGSAVSEDVPTLDALRARFTGFRLFCWGGGDTFGQIPDRDWSAAAGPGHAVRFTEAGHWDVFPPIPPTPCATGFNERGPCDHTWRLTTDVLTMFFGRYLHPHLGSLPPDHIPPSLIPPPLALTPAQVPFAANHLRGFADMGDDADCAGTSRWRTSFTPDIGAATFP